MGIATMAITHWRSLGSPPSRKASALLCGDVAAHLRSPEDGGRKARLQVKLEAKLVELDAHIEQARARRMMVLKLIGEVREARAGRAQSIQIGRSARGR